jgi:hypothetical protein
MFNEQADIVPYITLNTQSQEAQLATLCYLRIYLNKPWRAQAHGRSDASRRVEGRQTCVTLPRTRGGPSLLELAEVAHYKLRVYTSGVFFTPFIVLTRSNTVR